ncbi:hypothetical protein [Streptomyces albus]|uniref:hypothetical protein n=1 Tax=Streptomyces albus TaxID=1888 RepID=UPI0006E45831|nr:hypothetical protein [Streptomyces albus]
MLTLRLTLSAPPLALLLRLLLLCSSAAVGLLLLSTLSHALEHPRHPGGALSGLAWCLVPLAVTARLSAALGGAAPAPEARGGLTAAGLGPLRIALLAARTAAAPCVLGSALTLLVCVKAGADPAHAVPPSGAVLGLPLPGPSLPLPAALTLLSAAPVLAATAAAWGTREGRPTARPPAPASRKTGATGHESATASRKTGATGRESATASRESATAVPQPAVPFRKPVAVLGSTPAATEDDEAAPQKEEGRSAAFRAGLATGLLLAACGLLLARLAAQRALTGTGPAAHAGSVMTAGHTPADALAASLLPAGWLLAACGLVLAGPGLLALGGRLLTNGQPGPARLLAGRSLAGEASWSGRPLGALSAVAAATTALALTLLAGAQAALPGPLAALAALSVACCVVGTWLAVRSRVRDSHVPLGELLDRLGAPRGVRRSVTLLRAAVLTTVFVLLAAPAGALAALPPH